MLEERIVAQYESGQTSYLDVLLNSAGITEFISNYYLVSEIATYDQELLNEIARNKKEIEAVKTKLEESKNQIEIAKINKEKTSNALKNSQATKQNQVANLSEEEKQLQEELDQFKADQRQIQKDLAEIAAKDTTKYNVVPSSSGYIYPIPGTNRSSINWGYPFGCNGHTGIDFSGNYGKSVVAVKDGTVVKSIKLYGNISNYNLYGNYIGSYRSYGEYIVINHHDGTMTLYAHGLPGSRCVSVGQQVSQGQQIMRVGNTGNCLPRPIASEPTNGTHLHFEVIVNGRPVNPVSYLP